MDHVGNTGDFARVANNGRAIRAHDDAPRGMMAETDYSDGSIARHRGSGKGSIASEGDEAKTNDKTGNSLETFVELVDGMYPYTEVEKDGKHTDPESSPFVQTKLRCSKKCDGVLQPQKMSCSRVPKAKKYPIQ